MLKEIRWFVKVEVVMRWLNGEIKWIYKRVVFNI